MKHNTNIPIVDSHMHIWREQPLEDTVEFMKWVLGRYDYETISLLALVDHWRPDPLKSTMQNLKVMYLKKALAPKVYAYAHPHLRGLGPEDRGEYLLNQAKYYMDCGFDGIKLHYAHRTYTPEHPHIPLSDPRQEPFFAWLEQEQIPVVIHLTAPETAFCPDISLVPANQRKFYSGKPWHPELSLEYLLKDFTDMMDKFPNLWITVAHFGFITWHMDWCEKWLEKYPNLSFDLCPSLFMYYDFQNNPTAWRQFFLKYSDRIIYGTDIGSNNKDAQREEPDQLVNLVRGFFDQTEPIEAFNDVFYPIPLPEDVLRKLFKDNVMNYLGNRPPRQPDYGRMAAELELEASLGIPSALAAENLEKMRVAFLG